MRIAYLECFAGISGDMFLGALLDAGVPASLFEEAVVQLQIGASLRIAKVDRCGITAAKVDVLENGSLAEGSLSTESSATTREHHYAKLRGSIPAESQRQQRAASSLAWKRQPQTQHLHNTGYQHSHKPSRDAAALENVVQTEGDGHAHGRSLTEIRGLIQASSLPAAVKLRAIRTFEVLGVSEAKIHNVPVDAIHFHEVGAVDAIVDIVLASVGIEYLNAKTVAETGQPLQWHCSALNVGGGMVRCAHGVFPVPAPATADLLRGMPTYSAHVQKELVTPTGAAILRALEPRFPTTAEPAPSFAATSIGYGAGTRNPEGFPNVLRLTLGEAAATTGAAASLPVLTGTNRESLLVIETTIDDLSPQILAHVTTKALMLGALDVTTTATNMKKGRGGAVLTLLCRDQHAEALQRLLFTETTTLGLRIRREERVSLPRELVRVDTPYGTIAVKVATLDGKVVSATPEFDHCAAAAAKHTVPLKQVQLAAQVAFAAQQESQP